MTSPEAAAGVPRGPWAGHVLLLLLVAGWLADVGLAQPALVDPDEPRTALIARLMADRGDWLSPHLPAALYHDYPHDPIEGGLLAYWDKPPLYFWSAAAAMKVLGPTALAARLPAALAFVAAVLLVYAAGRFLWGGRAGLLAGLVMALAPLPLAMAHIARMDGLLAALMAVLLLAILRLMMGAARPWVWVLVLAVAGGLGVLAKGPEAVVFPAAAAGVTLLITGRWRDLLAVRPILLAVAGTALGLAVAVPWFLAMHQRYPAAADGSTGGYLYEFFIRQHLTRATGAEYEHDRYIPGMLLGIFIGGFMPWTIYLLASLAGLAREGWRGRRTQPAILLLVAWVLVILGVFSLSKTQLTHYILPVFPAAALLVGLYLSRQIERADAGKTFRVGLLILALLGLPTVVGVALVAHFSGTGQACMWFSVIPMTVVAIVAVLAMIRRRQRLAFGCMVAGLIVLASFFLAADPVGIYRKGTTYHQLKQMEVLWQPGAVVLAYPYQPYSFAWYTWSLPVVVLPKGPDEEGMPTEDALVEELNKPRQTFFVLQKRSTVEKLEPRVRWPLTVLSDPKDRYTFVVTEPPRKAE
jgi:4-amino-4-deoxy-L-arabinose transferase-like glycosyltransferase